jgi:hypothetical protein
MEDCFIGVLLYVASLAKQSEPATTMAADF